MAEEAERFRQRARQCRRLSESARTQADRDELADMARQLEEEADSIDRQETGQSGSGGIPSAP